MPVLSSQHTWFTALGAVAALTVGAAPGLSVGFSGPYAPANWTFSTEGDGTGSSVDTTGAPGSITLTSPNGGQPDIDTGDAPGKGLFTTTAAGSGTVSFDWSMLIGTEQFFASDDPFGYVLNGTPFQLSIDFLGDQVGSGSFDVIAGDLFGFYAETFTSQFGPSVVTVRNFSAPSAPTPVPGPLPVLGAAAFFHASRRLRVRLRASSKLS
jgi:hypothetical protein